MALSVDSYSQFKLYFAESSNLRPFHRIDLDEVHDVTSNAGFQVSFHPEERKDFIKGAESKFITEWDLAVINVTRFPFKALKEYVQYQLDEHIREQASTRKLLENEGSEADLFSIFIEPRILVYRRFREEELGRFVEKFNSELEDAFKTTFAVAAFNQKELNNLILETLRLRRKNLISSN